VAQAPDAGDRRSRGTRRLTAPRTPRAESGVAAGLLLYVRQCCLTSGDFHPGAFDLTRFQVLSDGTTAYLRATLANLDPTFEQTDRAQLLDVYVHVPRAASTSTAAPFASRNYSIAPSGAWSQRVEVQLDPTLGPVVIQPVLVP